MKSNFLLSRDRKNQEYNDEISAISVVEETWESLPLDKEIAKYIAEDEELEYDI